MCLGSHTDAIFQHHPVSSHAFDSDAKYQLVVSDDVPASTFLTSDLGSSLLVNTNRRGAVVYLQGWK